MDQNTGFWGFLDRVWEGVQNTGGKILDTINTRNMTEAQIAAAQAQQTQAQAMAQSAPFFGTDTTKLALAGVFLFAAYKFLK